MKNVYLLWTVHSNGSQELLAIYTKSRYQTAYNRILDIAERCGKLSNLSHHPHLHRTIQVQADSGQYWYLERQQLS